MAVQLVNSSQARNLPGRPKTDLLTELPSAPTGHRPDKSFPEAAELSRALLAGQEKG